MLAGTDSSERIVSNGGGGRGAATPAKEGDAQSIVPMESKGTTKPRNVKEYVATQNYKSGSQV